jgi:hypothetical protein
MLHSHCVAPYPENNKFFSVDIVIVYATHSDTVKYSTPHDHQHPAAQCCDIPVWRARKIGKWIAPKRCHWEVKEASSVTKAKLMGKLEIDGPDP